MDTLSGGGKAGSSIETRVAVAENRISNLEMNIVRMEMNYSAVTNKLDEIHKDILVNRGIRQGQESLRKWLVVLIPVILTVLTYLGITFVRH